MLVVEIKPLTVNQVWAGKRFKTPAYKQYEYEVQRLLPDHLELPDGKLHLRLIWGVSTDLSDWDNPIKPFQDVLQKKYKFFNDSKVRYGEVIKTVVKKGHEFIRFEFHPYEPSGELYEMGLRDFDTEEHEKKVLEEINQLAEEFADLYEKVGLKMKDPVLDIMRRALKYEKRVVIKLFREALKKRGIKSVENL